MTLKKIITVFVLVLSVILSQTAYAGTLILEYNGQKHEYNGSTYKLMINGKYINTSVEPLIFNDYTLVPIREVCESMGATVQYIDSTKQINVTAGSKKVSLKIGDNSAYINDKKVTIPGGVTPMLIAVAGKDAKTMVPLRFVSENLGYKVDFQGKNGLIKISAPEDIITLTKCTYSSKALTTTITVNSDKAIKSMTSAKLTNANVLYFDIEDCKYSLKNSYDVGSDSVKSVRFGTADGKTRIAVDTINLKTQNVKLSDDKKTITVTVTASKANSTVQRPSENNPSVTPPNNSKKIVVIDAGHGGTDPGTSGTTEDGKTYYEKDINLTVAKKVESILKSNGVEVVMTRTGDTYPSLTDRSDIANEYNAAIFTSIHSNSTTSDNATGFEVYYSVLNNSDDYGVTSKELANEVNKAIDDKISIRNRGVKTADHVVTRTSNMPAILVEIGFMTTPDELELMITDKFQNDFAQGIASGILKVFGKITVPQTNNEN